MIHDPDSCGGDTVVKDSRPCTLNGHAAIRRRRECLVCHQRFSTYEIEMASAKEQVQMMASNIRDRLVQQIDNFIGGIT